MWPMSLKHFHGKQKFIKAFLIEVFWSWHNHLWLVLQCFICSSLVENEVSNPILIYYGCCTFQVHVVQEPGTHMDQLTILKSKVI